MKGFGDQSKSHKKKVPYLKSKQNHYQILLQALKYHSEGNTSKAEKCYQFLIEDGFKDERVFNNHGMILINHGKLKEAELSIRKAIALNPNDAIAHSNLGGVLKDLGNLKEAKFFIQEAIKLKPNFGQAYYNMGCILQDLGELYDAINFYKKAIKLNDKFADAKWRLITLKGKICDWSDQKTQNIWIENLGIEGSYTQPFGLFYYEDNPLKQLLRAKNLYRKKYYRKSKEIHKLNNKKIRIGYFSSDFRAHPVMYLLASILKLHDKSKFEIYLYSFAPKEDKYTEIAKSSGCIFKDIKNLNDVEAVELSRNDKLDIAIDLMGYTVHNRMEIFSYRVAPIQISYLGYPGTLGANTIDYIIADEIIIPKKYESLYTEKVIRMPSCYQCNDNTKEICKEDISRKEYNLPEKGFVFTSFCANKKITPKEFDIWMRLLTKVKGSVLWLYKSNKYSMENLIKEAEKRNIDPNRLVFANKLPLLKKHLARYSLGDLGLDTFNFNGHTTTSDALWSGLPVLTKIGESFAARVSASILTSIGLPELIANSEIEYEEKALYIAENPEKLINLKSQLAKLRKTSTLYNSELFTRNLENKFMELNSN
ncbi:tetratricopeptide repeat protein [Prochlorococcus sp. MIT 1223]|uniref:O-linked N-acetylglucosamine transferase, SPINDLY family protein n=1 Tax=Prochlorococcus sp. MIT 1223 TaxID=3096217 RepID=UPI002A759B97|nr:tetratricopeptide repeat protein [Prochlorococcus sp. MIT 1223]